MRIKNYVLCMLAILALSLTSCDDGNNANDVDNGNDTPVIECEVVQIFNYYVLTVERGECGYILSFDTGSPQHWHGGLYWVENLPEEFRELFLPVTVKFCETDRRCGAYPIIDIVNITFNITKDNEQ